MPAFIRFFCAPRTLRPRLVGESKEPHGQARRGHRAGRIFPALSIADVEPVLPRLAEELRSVYSIAYYPDNQNFDGGWRKGEAPGGP